MASERTGESRLRGWIPALVVAAGALGYLLLRTIILTALSALEAAVWGYRGGNPWSGWWLGVTVTELGFCVGLFLALWLIAPIGGSLRGGHVFSRAALDWFVAVAVAFVVALLLGQTWGAPGFVDVAEGGVTVGLRELAALLFGSAREAVEAGIVLAPAVLAAAVLLWVRGRARPERPEAPGLVDRV